MKRFILILLLLCTTVKALFRYRERFYPGTLTVTFFDVGQGDATLVQFPKGSTLLIDAGRGFRNWDVGRAVLNRELRLRAILTLNRLLMTHPDQDHSFGLRGILSETRVDEFWINQVFLKEPDSILKERLDLARQLGVKLVSLFKEKTQSIDGVKARFIPLQVGKKTNNSSMILWLEWQKCKALFTGDIEKPGEEALVARVGKIDLLKVAHHGSKTSSHIRFLQQIKPRVGVISAGVENRYGHPHRVVTNRLRAFGTEVFRTDFHGMVTFESNGMSWTCRSTHGNCGTFKCGRY